MLLKDGIGKPREWAKVSQGDRKDFHVGSKPRVYLQTGPYASGLQKQGLETQGLRAPAAGSMSVKADQEQIRDWEADLSGQR